VFNLSCRFAERDAMAQLSRTFQIALVGLAVCVGVLLFTLFGRSKSTAGSSSTPAVVASTPAASKPTATKAAGANAAHKTSKAAGAAKAGTGSHAKGAGSSSHVYHGPVPGLEGLTRDVKRAHHAVSATGESPTSSSSSSSGAGATHASSPAKSVVKTPTHTSTASTGSSSAASVISARSSAQRAVEADLAKGKIVVLLFWNPQGAEDVTVHDALRTLAGSHGVAIQEAPASKVATYGSITRGVQVYATPTILIINKRGQTIVLTGLQEAFSIQQAITEARSS
jgi:hypothetical protein